LNRGRGWESETKLAKFTKMRIKVARGEESTPTIE
jgi:hypothetical protein